MGIVEDSLDNLGQEAAGVVKRTGPNVTCFQPGDRVMLMATGTFATNQIVSEDLCQKIPGGLNFADAASMPCVYATSIYSIFDVGNLRKGQVSLIINLCLNLAK